MNESITISEKVRRQITARATLVGLGVKVKQLGMLKPIEERVKIGQKVVKYTPFEKLTDGLIAMLSGAKGMAEVNKRVRSDPALQAAFGREGCAEQSVVQDTLDACTVENVEQMEQALDAIFRQHSRAYRHDYSQDWQVVEVDMTGRPCGRKAEFASKGYFAKQRNRRGRQEGYVVASRYEEIIVKRVYNGTTQLCKALQPLLQAMECTLGLTQEQRQRTILRIDSGGGSVDDVNYALDKGYQIHCKDFSGHRANDLAGRVPEWITDPADNNRQIGWVTETTALYHRPLKRIAVRCRRENGQWGVGVLLSSLSPTTVLQLTGQPTDKAQDDTTVLLAYVRFYDLRGGGIEIEIKEDKQGLATSKRNKKRFAAQQMVCQLEVLAHNLLVWAQAWLAPHCPKIARLGLPRLVRDVFHVTGEIILDCHQVIRQIILNPADPFAKELKTGLAALLAQEQVAVSLGEI
jgi:hypothetical protein